MTREDKIRKVAAWFVLHGAEEMNDKQLDEVASGLGIVKERKAPVGAFLTGSRCYGRPRQDSDYDLAVLLTSSEAQVLRGALGAQEHTDTPPSADDDSDSSFPLRFGALNLLVFTDHKRFYAWHRATEHLMTVAPVTRERAIECIRTEVARACWSSAFSPYSGGASREIL